MANSQSAYKKRPNILSSLSVLVRKRIELLFQTKGHSGFSQVFTVGAVQNQVFTETHTGMGSLGGFHLHCPLFSTLPTGYNEPGFPLEDSFKPSDPIFYKHEQRDINKLMKEK